MRIFLTGSTGYLGSYLVSMLMREHDAQLTLLVRAEDVDAAEKEALEVPQAPYGL